MTVANAWPALGSAVQLRTYATFRGQTAINTYYYLYTAVGTGSGAATWTASTLARLFQAAVAVPIQGLITNGATQYGCGVKVLSAPFITPFPETWSTPAYNGVGSAVGTAGTVPLPTQVCALVSFSTLQPGKQGRGRVYLPFLDDSQMVSATGLLLAATATLITTYMSGTIGGGNSITLNDGTGNTATFKQQIHRYGGPNYYAVTGFSVAKGLATQRRRGTTFGRLNTPPF